MTSIHRPDPQIVGRLVPPTVVYTSNGLRGNTAQAISPVLDAMRFPRSSWSPLLIAPARCGPHHPLLTGQSDFHCAAIQGTESRARD